MQKLIRHVIGGGILALLCSTGAFAQFDVELSNPLEPEAPKPRIFIGPIIGLNQNFHSGGFETTGEQDVECPVFDGGDASGIYIGLSGELRLGDDPATSNSSILIRAMYDTRGASFEEGSEELPARVGTGVESTSVTYVSEITYNVITVDVMYKLLFGESKFGIQVGPSLNVVSSLSNYQTLEMNDENLFFESPGDYTYLDPSAKNVLIMQDNSDFPNAASLRFSLKAGVIYEIPLRHFVFAPALVVPHVMYDLALTSVISGSEWSVSSLQTGVDIRWAF